MPPTATAPCKGCLAQFFGGKSRDRWCLFSPVQASWEGWGTQLPSCHHSPHGAPCCAPSPGQPQLCISLRRVPEVGRPPGPCPSGSLKRLALCPLDTCNTGAHVFKKPGPGDIPWACGWLSFPCSHSPPREGCKFGRGCIISRPTPSHISLATSLSVTPSCRPQNLPPPHPPHC